MANCFTCKKLEGVCIKWKCQADDSYFNEWEEDVVMPNVNCDEFDPSGKDVRELEFAACYDYAKASRLGLTQLKRWEKGVPHHKMSERLMGFLKRHDLEDYGNRFDWETGGDGDNGESLMYQLDAFFEAMDLGGTPMDRLQHLAVALGFKVFDEVSLVMRGEKDDGQPRWWMLGGGKGDQPLPMYTVDCSTPEEAIDAALAWLSENNN